MDRCRKRARGRGGDRAAGCCCGWGEEEAASVRRFSCPENRKPNGATSWARRVLRGAARSGDRAALIPARCKNEHRKGIFACKGCDTPAYKSETKFDSRTGWPSFWDVLPNAIVKQTDYKIGVPRTEVLCMTCGGHLGHLFDRRAEADRAALLHERAGTAASCLAIACIFRGGRAMNEILNGVFRVISSLLGLVHDGDGRRVDPPGPRASPSSKAASWPTRSSGRSTARSSLLVGMGQLWWSNTRAGYYRGK